MKYRKNFLSQVVLRVDYPRINEISDERRPELINRLAEGFPQVTPLQLAQIQFAVGPEQSAVDRKLVGYSWRMSSENGNKVVELTSTSLSLTNLNRSFTNFDEFYEEFRQIYQGFEELYKTSEFTRVGLRYINEIDISQGDALDWRGFLSEEIIHAIVLGVPDGFRLSRSMHQLVALKDDVTLVTNFGLFNPDYPAPIARKQFILDYDCYITGAVTRDAVLNRVTELNMFCENSFESAISDNLRHLMEVIRDQIH